MVTIEQLASWDKVIDAWIAEKGNNRIWLELIQRRVIILLNKLDEQEAAGRLRLSPEEAFEDAIDRLNLK